MFNKLLFTAIFAVLALGQGAVAVPQAGIVEVPMTRPARQANSAVSPAPCALAGIPILRAAWLLARSESMEEIVQLEESASIGSAIDT
ncbi:hypothetical protein C8R44DRAFT_882624 [Mycena epipterygia]|nr:hypothetical protein C8R44DRAFT_882624 [Mycena epipterygia]